MKRYKHKEEANMKKLAALVVAIGVMSLAAVKVARAESVFQAVAVMNVEVPDNFGITILNGPINLGQVTPTAATSPQELDITVRDNHNSDWYLNMGAESIVDPAADTIDNNLFKFTFLAAGTGVKSTPPGTYATVPSIGVSGEGSTVYTAAAAEKNGATGLGFLFKMLAVQESQPKGFYSTNLKFNLHSTI